jgi:hypothetical protein
MVSVAIEKKSLPHFLPYRKAICPMKRATKRKHRRKRERGERERERERERKKKKGKERKH